MNGESKNMPVQLACTS